jgi:hypothetical protein
MHLSITLVIDFGGEGRIKAKRLPASTAANQAGKLSAHVQKSPFDGRGYCLSAISGV